MTPAESAEALFLSLSFFNVPELRMIMIVHFAFLSFDANGGVFVKQT